MMRLPATQSEKPYAMNVSGCYTRKSSSRDASPLTSQPPVQSLLAPNESELWVTKRSPLGHTSREYCLARQWPIALKGNLLRSEPEMMEPSHPCERPAPPVAAGYASCALAGSDGCLHPLRRRAGIEPSPAEIVRIVTIWNRVWLDCNRLGVPAIEDFDAKRCLAPGLSSGIKAHSYARSSSSVSPLRETNN